MTSALSCVVLVDGVRLADGAATDPLDAPTALDGLRVHWGRSTTLDQPSPATCALTVADSLGGVGPFELLGVGRRLDVRTDATVYPDPTVPTVTDPGFSSTGPGQLVSNGTAQVGGGVARVTAADAARRLRVIFPPAPFGDGSDPSVWDTVPRTADGQQWRVGATVTLPPQLGPPLSAAAVHPVAFTSPLPSSASVLADTAELPPGSVATALALTITPPAGVWLGVAVDLYPSSPTWAQLDPVLTWAATPAAVTWESLATVTVDDLVVLAPAAGAVRSALVFSGRITDITASYDQGRAVTLLDVTAQDHTAELANRDVGDQVWAVEPLATRAQRIVTLSGQPTTLVVDAGVAATQVTRRDVDSQPATRLLVELAASVDGVLWSATHLTTGQYLRLEDTAARPPLLQLVLVGGVVVIGPRPGVPGAVPLDACDLLLDPVRFTSDVADVASRAVVRWQDQTTSPSTTERSYTLTDATLLAQVGVRRIGVGTQLTTAAAAQALASRLLARTSGVGYRVGGLTWTTGAEPLDATQVATAATLLDGTTRNGAPLTIANLPEWSPVGEVLGLFAEGGTYTFTDGAWTLDLTVSRAAGQGSGATWAQLAPTWTWQMFDPAIRWQDLTGVAAP